MKKKKKKSDYEKSLLLKINKYATNQSKRI